MEIGKEYLTLVDELIFRLDRLLDLYNHLGDVVNLLVGVKHSSSYGLIFGIGETAAFSGSFLHINTMTVLNHFFNTLRRHSDPELHVLDLFWNSDNHCLKSLKTVSCFRLIIKNRRKIDIF